MRFFFNCSKDQKQQVVLLVATCETVFSLNSSRAKSTRPPLTYREVLEQAKLQVAAAGLPEATLFLGNCYSGISFHTVGCIEVRIFSHRLQEGSVGDQGQGGGRVEAESG